MYKTKARVLGYRADGRPIHQIRGGAEDTLTPLDTMRELRAAKQQELDNLLTGPTAEKRSLSAEESAKFDAIVAEIRAQDTRIAELAEQDQRAAAAAEARAKAGASATVTEPQVYAKGNHAVSFFKDLARRSLNGDREASERLERHAKMTADAEQRALGNTNTTGGSGGEFAPPAWLVDEYIPAIRPLRPIADLINHMDIPRGVSSVNLPKILTGTVTALQTTQNTALSQTDITTSFVGTGISTIGGKELVSQQLLDQSGIPFDRVISQDLAADYARALDNQVINGTGTGANNNSVINGLANAVVPAANQITFMSGSPTAALLYSKLAGALAAFATNRLAEPTHWLMHPRRWYWLLAQVDGQNRPLVVPDAYGGGITAFNPMAENTGSPVQVTGMVGRLMGLPVVVDPLIPTTLGAGNNQDEIFLIKADDLWLMESSPVAEVFRDTYADSMGVLFRLYNYVGTILNRQLFSIATINGTGLTAPSF